MAMTIHAGPGPACTHLRRIRSRGAWALVLLPAILGAACVTVPPHQRDVLGRPEMNPATTAAEDVFHGHVEAAREAGFGGHGVAGGGCGCG
jgi:hypothetical protein